jgi:alpha,alpha-trehalase
MNGPKTTITLSRSDYDAVIFDMDGVVTQTARIHAAAWKSLFDEYLEKSRGQWKPFDVHTDYNRYVDGKPRYEGVKSFLQSRGVSLPEGHPEDEPGKETVCGLGNRKNQFFRELLEKKGVAVYEGAVHLVRTLKSASFKTAVVSSSKNCAAVLEAAGIPDLFDTRVDGVDSENLDLKGKPSPDIFLEATSRLQVTPERSVDLEDALAGVEAGKRGGFGCVIGVDRTGQAEALKEKGASVIVRHLSEIEVAGENTLPSALDAIETIEEQIEGKKVAVFLDYDGTLTPIVNAPEQAVLSDSMRHVISELAKRCTVAVVSGRDLQDVRDKVGIDPLFYAGSHGFDIGGPEDWHLELQKGKDFLPALDEAEGRLREALQNIEGTHVERKRFSIAVHYRMVKPEDASKVGKKVNQVAETFTSLRKSTGKKIYELQPKIDWDKGKALHWVLRALDLDTPEVIPFYIGDDTTDEDAFRVVRDRGFAIVVMDETRATEAAYVLRDPDEVESFLHTLVSLLS